MDVEREARLYLTAFRLIFLAWTAGKRPFYGVYLDGFVLDDRFTRGVPLQESSAGRAALAAVRCSFAAPDVDARHAAEAVMVAARAAGDAAALEAVRQGSRSKAETEAASAAVQRMWKETDSDTDASDVVGGRGLRTRVLLQQLWRHWPPAWATAARERFEGRLLELDQGFDIWIAWYARRVEGAAAGFDLPSTADDSVTTRILRETDAFWQREPGEVNAQIAAWLEMARDEQAGPLTGQKDFFISYASNDEPMAREIESILAAEGYSTVSQFRDFAPSSNFVREMQRGLAETSRLIALLSPAYEASDHCQAEWAAAYNEDPGSVSGKLLPFLLEPTELNPLARQIVYTSLVGLNRAERREAVLRAVQQVTTRHSPAGVQHLAGEWSSPDVVEYRGKLHAVANSKLDRAVSSEALVDLPATLRVIIGAITEALPQNAPRVVAACLERYREELAVRGARPIVGLIKALAAAVESEFRAADFELWGAGLSDLLESFFTKHALLISHFPLIESRERLLSEAPIDEAKAVGAALTDPVMAASDAFDDLSAEGLTTADFDRMVADQRQQAADLASLPPSETDLPATLITPKRRFVVGTIGFYDRSLAVLLSLTAVSTASALPAAIEIIRRSIERLLTLLL